MVESAELPEGTVLVVPETARSFVTRLLRAVDVPEVDASLVADVLVTADLRGIRSHGVARVSYFLARLSRGTINTKPSLRFTSHSPTTGILDADDAIGIVAADRGMREALAMAEDFGSGFVAIKRSSHFGYAGYWAARAMREGCIGISLSNSGRRTAPTFSTEAILGTNPISVTMPGAADGTDFYLDMATSAVAVGKIETALRENQPIPTGWTASGSPAPHLDDNGVLDYASPLLPLGGGGDVTGGHKGYGLSLLVELLCGALPGTSLASRIAGADGSAAPSMGHFMGAIKVDGFRIPEDVGAEMEATFATIRNAEKEPGRKEVLIPGEPEARAESTNRRAGIAITAPVMNNLDEWANRLSVEGLRE